MTEHKIDKATAESEFERFAEVMDIDTDTGEMDDESREGFQQQKSRMIRAMQRGNLIINESGEAVFNPAHSENPNTVTFKMPTGAALVAMDRKKKTEDMGKMYAAMGEICGVPAKTFAMMAMPDLKVCLAVTSLFLG